MQTAEAIARDLTDAQSALTRARAAVDEAAIHTDRALDAAAHDVLAGPALRRAEVALADAKSEHARLERRVRLLADQHASAHRGELRAALAAEELAADADAAMREIDAVMLSFVALCYAAGQARIDRVRARIREQHAHVARAAEIAVELGTETLAERLHVDDVRVTACRMVAQIREREGIDGPGIEAFMTPIADQFVMTPGGYMQANPSCSPDQFERAGHYLEGRTE